VSLHQLNGIQPMKAFEMEDRRR